MSESRSSSPMALTNKPSVGTAAAYLQQLQQHFGTTGLGHGENLLPGEHHGEHIDHAAADALVNLSNQHASRQHNGLANTTALHQLPPACGAKQLSKLKRFLTTLVQYGRDMGTEVCDRVRLLILALVNNLITVEEFHSKLQDLTGSPLRPFTIPFLKTSMPLLQRELAHCARLARQTPQQFLLSNESLVYAPLPQNIPPPSSISPSLKAGPQQTSSPLPAEPADWIESPFDNSPFVQHTRSQPAQMRLRERSPENASLHSSRSSPPNPKRVRSRSPLLNRSAPILPSAAQLSQQHSTPKHQGVTQQLATKGLDVHWLQHQHSGQQQQQQQQLHQQPSGTQLPPPLTSVSASTAAANAFNDAGVAANEEMWRCLEQQLMSLTEAASNCRRSAAALRERSREELLGVLARARIAGAKLGVAGASQEVDDIRRRAEEAVNEIKRQACLELQRGVAAAEQKAREMVAAERGRMMRELAEARQRGFDEANATWVKQDDLPENCSNCGRMASERCSACEQVRYCGRFCQLHDWQRHRLHCRQLASGELNLAALSSSSSTSRRISKEQVGGDVDQKEAAEKTPPNETNHDSSANTTIEAAPATSSPSTPAGTSANESKQRVKTSTVKVESTAAAISPTGRSDSCQSSS